MLINHHALPILSPVLPAAYTQYTFINQKNDPTSYKLVKQLFQICNYRRFVSPGIPLQQSSYPLVVFSMGEWRCFPIESNNINTTPDMIQVQLVLSP